MLNRQWYMWWEVPRLISLDGGRIDGTFQSCERPFCETAATAQKHAGCQTVDESTTWNYPDCFARRFCKQMQDGGDESRGSRRRKWLWEGPTTDAAGTWWWSVTSQKGGTSDWVAVQSCETRRSRNVAATLQLPRRRSPGTRKRDGAESGKENHHFAPLFKRQWWSQSTLVWQSSL